MKFKDWIIFLVFGILITILVVYSYYCYNEFIIAQSVIVLIFLFSQFILYRINDKNTELLRKQFLQDSYVKERFRIVSQIDKHILKLINVLYDMKISSNSDDYSDKDIERDKIDLEHTVYEFSLLIDSNSMFLIGNELITVLGIYQTVNDFSVSGIADLQQVLIPYVEEAHNKFKTEFQKSLLLV